MNIKHLEIAEKLSKVERKQYTTADLAEIIIRAYPEYRDRGQDEIEVKIAERIYQEA